MSVFEAAARQGEAQRSPSRAGFVPGIESVKWFGLVAMLYDHLAFFGGVPLPWANHIGAFALPMFAIALAEGLRNASAAKLRETSYRMFRWGAVATLPLMFVREPLPLNILFTLGFATLAWSFIRSGGAELRTATKHREVKSRSDAAAQAVERSENEPGVSVWPSFSSPRWDVAKATLALLATLFSEFSILGGAFVLVAFAALSEYRREWWVLLASVPLFVFNEGSFLAVPATLAALLLARLEVGPPRMRHVFYIAYTFQWVVLAVM